MKKIKDFFANWTAYLLLAFILIGAFYLRVYRIDDLLGFYYDQGRDALVIWNLWHQGKFFLIGPITGLSGIFLGPFYYYLIAPIYLIGGGNPIYVSVFLAFLTVVAVFLIFIMGKEMHSKTAALVAALISAFAYHIINVSRWLSNPNPMLLLSLFFLYSLWKIISTSEIKWWVIASFIMGVSLHFESASAFFYIPVFIIFTLWRLISAVSIKNFNAIKRIGSFLQKYAKLIFFALSAFIITLIPQIIFNLRHDNILLNNLYKLFFHEKAFKPFTVFILETRIAYFWSAFVDKIFIGLNRPAIMFTSLSLASLIFGRKHFPKGLLTLFSIFLITPLVGYILFQGNFGNIYDYYLIGYFLPFILLFSMGLAEFAKTAAGKVLLIVFFAIFFQVNSIPISGMMKNQMDGPTDIIFGSQLKAVNWVFENAAGRGVYNLDVYVPPVIPYAYDYLFLWQGKIKCGNTLCGKVDYQTPILYTLFEQDPPNPDRLQAWLDKQKGIGVVEEEAKFGGITVQRRSRT